MEEDLFQHDTKIREDVVHKFNTGQSKTRRDTQEEGLLLTQRMTVYNRPTDNPEIEYIRYYSETEPLMYSSDSYFTTFLSDDFLTAQLEVR